jgi:hypothetical protein
MSCSFVLSTGAITKNKEENAFSSKICDHRHRKNLKKGKLQMSVGTTAVAASSGATISSKPNAIFSSAVPSNLYLEVANLFHATLGARAMENWLGDISPQSTPQEILLKSIDANVKSAGQVVVIQKIIWEYFAPIDATEQNFSERLGFGRFTKTPKIEASKLDIGKFLPWNLDGNHPDIDVSKIPVKTPAVRGEYFDGDFVTQFIAMRYISSRGEINAELVFLREDGALWGQRLFGHATRVTDKDLLRLRNFLDGQEITAPLESAERVRFTLDYPKPPTQPESAAAAPSSAKK